VGTLGRRGSEGDDEDLLVLQSGYKTGLVVVVNLGWGDALWDIIGAGIAGKGRDMVFPSLNKGGSYVRPDCTRGLRLVSVVRWC
jgi:hypothetical protein